MRHDDVNTVTYFPLAQIPLIPNYNQGFETNLAKHLSQIGNILSGGPEREILTWIFSEIPNTRIDFEMNPEQDGILISAVFADQGDAAAFRLRWFSGR